MNDIKLKLGINVDHVATLRQARGINYPSPIEAALLCEQAGANGITAHLREDRRHIQDTDIKEMREKLSTRLNMEMANVPEIVDIALKIKPDEVCLVPEKREELTTEGGLNVAAEIDSLKESVERLSNEGITVSMFIDPDKEQLEASKEIGAPFVELHTGSYANASDEQRNNELQRLIQGSTYGHNIGLSINAGHGLNLENISQILQVPYLDTLNIGHSIISRSVFVGISQAVKEMLQAISEYNK
jgi:pyridoxine 5-phosphate synthase